MEILRTPDDRFLHLPDYPFDPNYVDIELDEGIAARQHYVDEGPRDGPVVLLVHGEPSWSYLYRKMIPPLAAAGMRVIAPDLIGFGKSDKPASRDVFTYRRHAAWLNQFIDAAGLSDITLFCQDWGGLLSLRIVAERPELFVGVVASNTTLPIGVGMSDAFMAWQDAARNAADMPIGSVLQQACVRELSAAEIAAYDAPFPDARHKSAAHVFPLLVPVTPGDEAARDNLAAWEKLAQFDRPFVTLFGDSDPVTKDAQKPMQERIRGAQGQDHRILSKTGHFSQEDAPGELAKGILDLIEGLP